MTDLLNIADELKDCPFCGSKPKVTIIGNDHTKSRSIIVKCPSCRIQRKDSAIRFGIDWLKRVAKEQWNARV